MTGLILAHLADLLTFLLVLRVPGANLSMEANPMIRFAYGNAGIAGIVGFKLVGLILLVLILRDLQTRRPHWVQPMIFGVTAAGLIGALANTASGLML